jgi:hypothetical protein
MTLSDQTVACRSGSFRGRGSRLENGTSWNTSGLLEGSSVKKAIAMSSTVTFDTKVAILILDDLAPWQKLNVAAFLATGIAGAAPEAMGEVYEDAIGRRFERLLGQPMLVFAAKPEDLQRAHRVAVERDLTRAAYVRAMFATGHDAANREAFRAEPVDAPDLVGFAVRGLRKDVDRATKGAKLHP